MGDMLRRFEVQNYKCFDKGVVLDFTTSKDYNWNTHAISNGIVSKALLYGKNGAGKSSLLEALMSIRGNMYMVGQKLGVKSLVGHSDESVAMFLYEFQFDSDIVVYQFSKYWPHSLAIFNEAIFLNGKSLTSSDPEFDTVVQNIHGFIYGMEWIDFSVTWFSNVYCLPYFLYEIAEHGLVGELEEFLHTYNSKVELDTRSAGWGKSDYDVIIKDGTGKTEFSSVASTGEQCLAGIFYYMQVMQKHSFVGVDMIDWLCSEVASDLLVTLSKQFPNVQMLLITNNTDLLDNDILRPDCYYIIGEHGVKALPDLTNKDLRKAHNLQKMYKAGAFGG